MSIRAWAPGHATLFFAVPTKTKDPLSMGSLGGGINFEHGVVTEVSPSDKNEVYWNGSAIDGKVSLTTYELFKQKTGYDKPVRIDHRSELRIGHGLSTSGAGAIGTSLALNALADTELDMQTLYQIAHIADAINHTGLGSVMGQITSGIELRFTVGGPGVGATKSYPSDEAIVIVMMGPLRTDEVLVSQEQMEVVTSAGLKAVKEAKELNEDVLSAFIEIGREFTFKCGLLTSRIEALMTRLSKIGETQSAMAMIGETLIVKPQDMDHVLSHLDGWGYDYVVSKISMKKPHLIE